MSMITEQVEELREEADFIIETIDRDYPATIGVAKIMKRAADTIEQLAAKVRTENYEPKLDEWCTDCKEYDTEKHCCPRFNRVIRNTLKDSVEAYKKAFEDIKTELEKQYKWLMQTKHTLHDIDIAFDAIKSTVDKHNPDKVGKERE